MYCNFHKSAVILNNQRQIACSDFLVTMDDVVFAAAVAAVQQFVTAVYALLFDTPTFHEKRVTKKRKREETSCKRNVSVRYSSQSSPYKKSCWMKIVHTCTNLPTFRLGNFSSLVRGFTCLLRDQGKVKWNKVLIANMITFTICSFALNGSTMATSFWTREVESGWGKSSIHRDTCHVLQAIVGGLNDELQWPDVNWWREMASIYNGIFQGWIGISDVKEFDIEKPTNCVMERRTFSGKKKTNSYKMLSVMMDRSGRYIYLHRTLGKNDREVLTSSLLYLQEGDFFSDGEFLAADGAFEGNCWLHCLH
jgi:hypothetical protein